MSPAEEEEEINKAQGRRDGYDTRTNRSMM
jgi:hypothetical protein